MFFKRHAITLMMRETELDETIRSPIDATEARKLIKHIENWKSNLSTKWKTRANAHQEKLDTGDPFSYGEVYKGLSERQAEGTLSAADRMHLKQSAEFLGEELANAMGQTESQALARIEEASQAPAV
jgi:RNA polymerase-interacting CarD/CdnL/TRCF family regulator